MNRQILGASCIAMFGLFSGDINATPIHQFSGAGGFYYVPTDSRPQEAGRLAAPQASDRTPSGGGSWWQYGRTEKSYNKETGLGSLKQWVSSEDILSMANVTVGNQDYVEFYLDLDFSDGRARYMHLTDLRLYSIGSDSVQSTPLWDMNSSDEFRIVLNDGVFAAGGNPELAILIPKILLQGVEQLMLSTEVKFLNGQYLNAVLSLPDPKIQNECSVSRGQSCDSVARPSPSSFQVPTPSTYMMMILGLGIIHRYTRRMHDRTKLCR